MKGPKANVSCRCGRDKVKKDPNYVACSDLVRKSKCPCLREGKGCGAECQCANCGNCNGEKQAKSDSISESPPKKRNRTSPSPYKRTRSAEFLAAQGTHPKGGPWTTEETCLLYSIICLLGSSDVKFSVEDLSTLYNNTVDSSLCKTNNHHIRSKTLAQISAKYNKLAEKQRLELLLAS